MNVRSLGCILVLGFACPMLGGCKTEAPKEQNAAPSAAISMTVDTTTAKVGDSITVKFSSALTPPAGQQYWITVAPAGSPAAEWGDWHYLPSGATSDTLIAKKSGEFEIRLHDLYPQSSTNLLATSKLTVKEDEAKKELAFTLDKTTVKAGTAFNVTYNQALTPPSGQQYWITLVPAGAPDGDWGTWHYVAADATSDNVPTKEPGKYEVRLHNFYPANSNVLVRQAVEVTK